jgi:5'(3')-deoxyribonucleotidase
MPSDEGTVVLGVDLDGVCADFYARMREVAAEWFELDVKELTPNPSYGLRQWGIKDRAQYERLHRFAVTQRQLFATVPPIAGARTTLRKLSEEGYRIRIITHRLFIHFFHRDAVSQTIDWLDQHGFPYWDLCFMKEKDQVGADVYIDDAPQNIQRLRAHRHYVICFGNSTNVAVAEPRAENWSAVYTLIKRKFPVPHMKVRSRARRRENRRTG